MPLYSCRTIAPSGTLRESKIEAESETLARSMFQGKGEVVLRIRRVDSDGAGRAAGGSRRKPTTEDIAAAFRQMSILARAGIPLVEGLSGLAENCRPGVLRDAFNGVAADVSQGAALSEAFAQHPHVFPAVAADMAKVAEAGGDLSKSLARLADHLEKAAEIKRKIKSALAYPIVVVCISLCAILALVTFILPRFMRLFKTMGVEVPWTTNMLMAFGHLLLTRWYVVLLLIALTGYLVRRYARTKHGKRKLDAMLLKLPIVGDIATKVILSRTLASMSTLLASGVPMVQALETSASAADNLIVKEALQTARDRVAEGSSTSQAFRSTELFPPLVLQMIACGEKTGDLPALVDHVCAMYEQETDIKVKALTTVIEPILIVGLGLIVGFIAVSVVLPIYSLVGGVK